MATLAANTELVAVQWLLGISGLSSGMVSTQLPKDQSSWASTGFVTVSTLGGGPNNYTGARGPFLQIDCWATSIGSNKPQWFLANRLAELIVAACRGGDGRAVTLPNGYPAARVLQAWVVTEPRRVYGDPGNAARYTMNLALSWIQP